MITCYMIQREMKVHVNPSVVDLPLNLLSSFTSISLLHCTCYEVMIDLFCSKFAVARNKNLECN